MLFLEGRGTRIKSICAKRIGDHGALNPQYDPQFTEYVCIIYIPVVPHKAVAEVSKIGNL